MGYPNTNKSTASFSNNSTTENGRAATKEFYVVNNIVLISLSELSAFFNMKWKYEYIRANLKLSFKIRKKKKNIWHSRNFLLNTHFYKNIAQLEILDVDSPHYFLFLLQF